jgi:cell division protein FtsL
VLGLLAAARNLSSSRALDRLIAGRIWIVLIAFALIGIVTLQLLVLGLNASIGRALVRDAQLQRENATLSIENSELAAGERVESQAARLGMELVPVGALRFLTADPRADIARAAAALSAPLHTATTSSSEAGTTMPPASPTSEAGATTPPASPTGEAGATTSPTNPTGEASAPVSTQAPASPTGEAAPASAQSAPPSASAPATAAAAAGGTESTGAG